MIEQYLNYKKKLMDLQIDEEYAHKLAGELKAAGIRAEVDTRAERMGSKIRLAQLEKVPYMLVVGDKEAESGNVSVRLRSGEQLADQPFGEFKKKVSEAVASRTADIV